MGGELKKVAYSKKVERKKRGKLYSNHFASDYLQIQITDPYHVVPAGNFIPWLKSKDGRNLTYYT